MNKKVIAVMVSALLVSGVTASFAATTPPSAKPMTTAKTAKAAKPMTTAKAAKPMTTAKAAKK